MVNRLLGLIGLLLLALFVVLSKLQVDNSEKICKVLKVDIVDQASGSFFSNRTFMELLQMGGINPKGRPLDAINTEEIEQQLNRNEYIQRATCYKNIKGEVCLSIRQEVPLFRVSTQENSYYVTKDRSFLSSTRPYGRELLCVTGSPTRTFCKGKLFDFIEYIQETKPLDDLIVRIDVSNNEELTLYTSLGYHEVLFGEIKDVEEKFNNLILFYQKGITKMGWDRYSKINVKYHNQIVCTLRP